jgi:hypothetical protein
MWVNHRRKIGRAENYPAGQKENQFFLNQQMIVVLS